MADKCDRAARRGEVNCSLCIRSHKVQTGSVSHSWSSGCAELSLLCIGQTGSRFVIVIVIVLGLDRRQGLQRGSHSKSTALFFRTHWPTRNSRSGCPSVAKSCMQKPNPGKKGSSESPFERTPASSYASEVQNPFGRITLKPDFGLALPASLTECARVLGLSRVVPKASRSVMSI